MTSEALIVAGVRTPIGALGGVALDSSGNGAWCDLRQSRFGKGESFTR